MFKRRFEQLCNQINEAPTAVCKKINLSNAAYSKWTEDTVPRRTTLLKCAEYFGVPVECFTDDNIDESDIKIEDREKFTSIPERTLNEGEALIITKYRETTAEGRARMTQSVLNIFDEIKEAETK